MNAFPPMLILSPFCTLSARAREERDLRRAAIFFTGVKCAMEGEVSTFPFFVPVLYLCVHTCPTKRVEFLNGRVREMSESRVHSRGLELYSLGMRGARSARRQEKKLSQR